jgi:hypothetical protein
LFLIVNGLLAKEGTIRSNVLHLFEARDAIEERKWRRTTNKLKDHHNYYS